MFKTILIAASFMSVAHAENLPLKDICADLKTAPDITKVAYTVYCAPDEQSPNFIALIERSQKAIHDLTSGKARIISSHVKIEDLNGKVLIEKDSPGWFKSGSYPSYIYFGDEYSIFYDGSLEVRANFNSGTHNATRVNVGSLMDTNSEILNLNSIPFTFIYDSRTNQHENIPALISISSEAIFQNPSFEILNNFMQTDPRAGQHEFQLISDPLGFLEQADKVSDGLYHLTRKDTPTILHRCSDGKLKRFQGNMEAEMFYDVAAEKIYLTKVKVDLESELCK